MSVVGFNLFVIRYLGYYASGCWWLFMCCVAVLVYFVWLDLFGEWLCTCGCASVILVFGVLGCGFCVLIVLLATWVWFGA